MEHVESVTTGCRYLPFPREMQQGIFVRNSHLMRYAMSRTCVDETNIKIIPKRIERYTLSKNHILELNRGLKRKHCFQYCITKLIYLRR